MELGNESRAGTAEMAMNGQTDRWTSVLTGHLEEAGQPLQPPSGFLSAHPSRSLPGRRLPAPR